MGLSGPDENAVVLRRRDGLAETRCCHRSWPLWARNGHAKPGFQEPLTLILGQAHRLEYGLWRHDPTCAYLAAQELQRGRR